MGRRRLVRAAAALLVLILMTGCGIQNMGAGDLRQVLKVALREGTYSKVVQQSLKAFEERHHVRCEILELSEEELHKGLLDEKDKKEGSYDLYMVDGSWMAEYTAKGLLADLGELGYSLDEDIIRATSEVCYRKDHLYLAPYFGNVTVLLYNKLILRKAGLEEEEIESLEDVLRVCEYAQSKGNLGFMYRGDTNNNIVVDFLPILSSFGGWVIDPKGHPTVNTPEFKKAMKFYQKLIATGKPETRDNLTIAIANNAAAMAVGWPGWYTPGRNATADYCAFSGKVSEDANAYQANIYGIWTLGIPENAQKKEMAVKLLSYLMDPEVQYESVEYGGVPCRYSSLKDPEILKKFPQYEAVEEALENGIYRPMTEKWPDFYEILGDEMKQIILSEKSMEKGLADAQKRLEKLGDCL